MLLDAVGFDTHYKECQRKLFSKHNFTLQRLLDIIRSVWQPISKIKPFTEMNTKSRRRMAKFINMFRNMNVSVQYHIQLAPNAVPIH